MGDPSTVHTPHDAAAPQNGDDARPASDRPMTTATAVERAADSRDSGTAAAPATAGNRLDHLGLTRGDVRFAAACGSLILLLLCAHWAQHRFGGRPLVEIDHLPAKAYEFRLDINSATWVEWMQLEGIGEMLARRIVADREQNGRFAGIDDLRRVPGIGPKTLERIEPHLVCSDCP